MAQRLGGGLAPPQHLERVVEARRPRAARSTPAATAAERCQPGAAVQVDALAVVQPGEHRLDGPAPACRREAGAVVLDREALLHDPRRGQRGLDLRPPAPSYSRSSQRLKTHVDAEPAKHGDVRGVARQRPGHQPVGDLREAVSARTSRTRRAALRAVYPRQRCAPWPKPSPTPAGWPRPASAARSCARCSTASCAAGRDELAQPRSGYDDPSRRGRRTGGRAVVAVAPGLRRPARRPRRRARARLAPDRRAGRRARRGRSAAATLAGGRARRRPRAALAAPGDGDAELAALAFEEQVAQRRPPARARARLPAHVLEQATDWRAPIGAAHPLRIAEHVARLGGRPADADALAEHEDAVLALLGADAPAARAPHDDPDPARRVARRILQRLNGMGKWGGYHTEFAPSRARLRAATTARSPTRSARRCSTPGCSPRSRASASATSSSTRAARPTSTR